MGWFRLQAFEGSKSAEEYIFLEEGDEEEPELLAEEQLRGYHDGWASKLGFMNYTGGIKRVHGLDEEIRQKLVRYHNSRIDEHQVMLDRLSGYRSD